MQTTRCLGIEGFDWRKLVAGALSVVVLAVTFTVEPVRADDSERDSRQRSSPGSFDMQGVAAWFERRFSAEELQNYQPEDFRIEHHQCNCSDRPVPHYPYILVFFATPKGDLVGRPEQRGFDTVIIPLAVRHGERYCDINAEDDCYGSFSQPCAFSDFRYGGQLAEYFPTCKVLDRVPDPQMTPAHYSPSRGH